MYGKMLLEQNYSIGKKVSEYYLHELPSSIDYEDVVWVEGLKGELIEDLLKDFNCSRRELIDILCFCSMALENYLYDRIVPRITTDKDHRKPPACGYPLTLSQIYKLLIIRSPMLFDRQIYHIVSIFEFEYSRQNSGPDPLIMPRNQKDREFADIIKLAGLKGLR